MLKHLITYNYVANVAAKFISDSSTYCIRLIIKILN